MAKVRTQKNPSSAKTSKKTASKRKASADDVQIIEPEIVLDDERGNDVDDDPANDLPDAKSVEDFRKTLPAQGLAADIDPDRDISLDELPIARPPRPRATRVKKVKAEIVSENAEDAGGEASSGSPSNALTAADPIAMYLAEIRRYPLLTKEQEKELATRYRETGDAKAAELLVTSNLRFVVKIAAEYSRFGAKLIDLIQEGNVGLMHAVKEFNPYRGVRLITYAVWWIRGYIQEYLMRQYSLVRIGTTQNQRKLFYRLQKERDALESLGQEPNTALLAGRLGVTEEEVETMTQRMSGRDVSLSQPADPSGNSTASLLDFEPSELEAVDEQLGHLEEMKVLKEHLQTIRSQLTEKETYILEKRVLADEPMTLQEIGEHYGVTREAVRQIEARLIGRIRAAVTKSLNNESDDSRDED